MKYLRSILAILFSVVLFAGNGIAQDAAKADPKHYKVEFENDKVRVLRVTYNPGEKSNMHNHPDAVAIMLTDMRGDFKSADGKSEEITGKAGQVMWTPATKHLPSNTGDGPFEVILVELKSRKK